MKLRNKRSGEIVELLAKPSFIKRNADYLQSEVNTFNSLADLNEEWEDYKGPKENWYISDVGEVEKEGKSYVHDMEPKKLKEIGNYFDTREEAEKAVEKLKAWKRLKDKGFEFTGWGCENQKLYAKIRFNKKAWATETEPDLDLLFGGEE